MNVKPEIWAIIPTRGGSTGLPEKNVRVIAGKPLLHYILESAIHSQHVTRVILTTDSDQIAEIAQKINGVSVERHDPALSIDGRPSFLAFQQTFVKSLEKSLVQPEAVALLRVTTPLCLPYDIDTALELLISRRGQITSVLSVVESDVHPKRLYILDENGLLRSREDTPEKNFPLPRQVFDTTYIRNGAIYATFPNIILQGSLWGNRPFPYVMPKNRSININDEVDFILAEELLKRK